MQPSSFFRGGGRGWDVARIWPEDLVYKAKHETVEGKICQSNL